MHLNRGKTDEMTQPSQAADVYKGRDPRTIPAYTTVEAARYLRIPERTLFDWAFGYSYKTRARESRHRGGLIMVAEKDRHLLSFTNLAELHVLDGLRRVHRLRMKEIRQ